MLCSQQKLSSGWRYCGYTHTHSLAHMLARAVCQTPLNPTLSGHMCPCLKHAHTQYEVLRGHCSHVLDIKSQYLIPVNIIDILRGYKAASCKSNQWLLEEPALFQSEKI